MRTTHKKSCSGCYWCCQCSDRSDDVCGDYTPLDPEEDDIAYYNKIVKENYDEYESVIEEYNDGNIEKENKYGKERTLRKD